VTVAGEPFSIRDYQQGATDTFYASGGNQGGSGVVVLPCGAGKTMVAISVMAKYQETA
jgi:DNA excision repair protein ERCC-3